MFAIYVGEPSGRPHRQCGHDGGQQGRAAGLRRDGADAGGASPPGIDLSVGMIFVLTNCLASWLVVGSPLETAFGVVGGAAGRPRSAARSTGSSSSTAGCSRSSPPSPPAQSISAWRCCCGRFPAATVNEDLADALTGQLSGGVPASLVVLLVGRAGGLGAVPPLGDRPRRLCGRLVGGGRLHVGRADPRAPSSSAYTPVGPARRRSAGCSSPSSPIRARRLPPTATPTRSIRSPPWCSAACRCSAARAARSGRSSGR